MTQSLTLRASLLSGLILLLLLGIWHVATLQPAGTTAPAAALTPEEIEYLKLQGKDPGGQTRPSSGFPTLAQMGDTVVKHLSDPFYDNGPNDKGIGIQLGW